MIDEQAYTFPNGDCFLVQRHKRPVPPSDDHLHPFPPPGWVLFDSDAKGVLQPDGSTVWHITHQFRHRDGLKWVMDASMISRLVPRHDAPVSLPLPSAPVDPPRESDVWIGAAIVVVMLIGITAFVVL